MAGRRWSVMLTRDGATSARRFRITERRLVVGLVVALLLAATGLIGIGRWSVNRTVPHAVATLQGSLDSLTEENARISVLAARLGDLEVSYRRLRAVMGGEVEPSARDILLPPARSGGDAERQAQTSSTIPAVWPLVEAGFITRSFGDSVSGEGLHTGLDIAVPVGSYVRSAGAGIVLEAADDGEYGRFVRVEHHEGITALYAHNSWTFVVPGDSVETGEVIALSGNTGRSTAPHLHLEIEQGGVIVDPLPFVAGRL